MLSSRPLLCLLLAVSLLSLACGVGEGAGLTIANGVGSTVRLWVKDEGEGEGLSLGAGRSERVRLPREGDYHLEAYNTGGEILAVSCTFHIFPGSTLSATLTLEEGKGAFLLSQSGRDTLFQGLLVPSSGEVVRSKPLERDRPYLIVVSGTWGPWEGFQEGADAAYIYLKRRVPERWISLVVEEKDFEPQEPGYQESHRYTMRYQGRGTPLSLRIRDSRYDDNLGALNVQLLRLCSQGK